MNSYKKKNTIYICIIVLLLVAISVCFGIYLNIDKDEAEISSDLSVTHLEDEFVVIDDPIIKHYRETWANNKQINNDYVGELVFDSGLVECSFVQAKSIYDSNGDLYHCFNLDGTLVQDGVDRTGNDVYIYTNWKDMSYDYNILGGSIFMDYRNTLGDQNLLVYGHHFSENGGNDPERIKAFTPLEKLMSQDNYEENKIVKIYLENEVREYELAYVYVFDSNDDYYWDNCQYWRTNYNYDDYSGTSDDNYYQNYIESLDKVSLYDTGVEITPSDINSNKTLTLQTCISNHAGELYEILVFRQNFIKAYQ